MMKDVINHRALHFEKIISTIQSPCMQEYEKSVGKEFAPGCLESREGNIIMEKILERWSKYISELYHDEICDKPPIMKNFDGPPIMKDEVRKAVKSCRKARLPDQTKLLLK